MTIVEQEASVADDQASGNAPLRIMPASELLLQLQQLRDEVVVAVQQAADVGTRRQGSASDSRSSSSPSNSSVSSAARGSGTSASTSTESRSGSSIGNSSDTACAHSSIGAGAESATVRALEEQVEGLSLQWAKALHLRTCRQ